MLRLLEGVRLLAESTEALAAFQFANQAMGLQRIHSRYALERRRGKRIEVAELAKDPRNYSWRPFQLVFLLLSIPGLTDPRHADRIK
ncbi:hypothetical protein, partial [Streptococcus pyogenes]|uniref:hypothetical protein n=1 Tax=Streptococcus pyogenes TaxID=1314 RepID=UPI003DA19EEF